MTLRSRLIRLAHENPEFRSDLLPLLRVGATRVDPRMGLMEVRANLEELLSEISDEELRVLRWTAKDGQLLWSGVKGGPGSLGTLQNKSKPVRDETAGTTALGLARRGWMKFEPQNPEGTFGTYRPTKAGENLVVALGEAKGKSLLQGR